MLEIEVKVKTNGFDEIIRILNNEGFKEKATIYEKDIYFNGEIQDMKKNDKALRIRTSIDDATKEVCYELNYKGPKIDDSTMTREEIQFDIPDYESGEKLLNGLGYREVAGVEKRRTYFKKDDMTVCLDKVTELGSFVEIEIVADESEYDASIERIKNLLRKLDLKFTDTIRKSYLSMLEEQHKEIENALYGIENMMHQIDKKSFGAQTGIEWEGVGIKGI